MRTKLLAYGVGAALGGMSGAFLASYLSTVNPNQFTFSFSIFILAMVVVGGTGSIWGVVVGAILLSAFNNYLLPNVLYDVPSIVGLDFDLSQVTSGIYGFLLVLVMLLRSQTMEYSLDIARLVGHAQDTPPAVAGHAHRPARPLRRADR